MLDNVDPGWLWLIGGVLLLTAEIIAPGFFLVFVGAAAVATGLFTLLFDLGVASQLALFALYATVAVLAGRRWYAQPSGPDSNLLLNDRAAALVGRSFEVVSAVDEHGGRIRVGDSEWSARGGPAEPGDRVQVVGIEGNCLIVEGRDRLPPT